jgi:hypothetical protein
VLDLGGGELGEHAAQARVLVHGGQRFIERRAIALVAPVAKNALKLFRVQVNILEVRPRVAASISSAADVRAGTSRPIPGNSAPNTGTRRVVPDLWKGRVNATEGRAL